MIAVLLGEGWNDLKIPVMIFPSLADGLEQCKKIFIGDEVKFSVKVQDTKTVYRWFYQDDPPEEVQNKVFTSYYGGCGGCYGFILKEVEYGTPFVRWDLGGGKEDD